MSSKTIIKTFFSLLFTGIAVVCISSGFSLSRIYSPKIALGAEAVVCDCSLLGTNHYCAANNYGANCAPQTLLCSDYNSNCEA
jgi:hypothetical protein